MSTLHTKNKLCSNRFASSHQSRNCTSTHNCFTCQDRHNTLVDRNSGSTTPLIPSDPPRPVSASIPHKMSSYSAQVSRALNPSKLSALFPVQKYPLTNNTSENWVPYPTLNVPDKRAFSSGGSVERQFSPDVYISHARTALLSPSSSAYMYTSYTTRETRPHMELINNFQNSI